MHTPQWRQCLARAVPRRRPAGDHRLSVGDERRAARVDGAARCARRRPAHRGRTASSPTRAIAAAFDQQRLPHPVDASPVRAADRVSQGDRLAARSRCWSERRARPHRPAQAVRLAGHARRRTVRVLVTGATGFTGGHLARALAARGDTVSRARPRRRPARGGAGARRASSWSPATCAIRRPSAAATAGVDVVYHIAAIYRQAGLPDDTYRAVNATAVRRDRSRRPPAPASSASCTAARSASTATSSIRPPTKTRRSSPGDIYQVTKLEGERLAREAAARLGIEVTIARPTGIYGPGDRRLLKLFRGVARRPLGDARARRNLLPSDLHRRSGRRVSSVRRRTRRRPTAPTSSPAGR